MVIKKVLNVLEAFFDKGSKSKKRKSTKKKAAKKKTVKRKTTKKKTANKKTTKKTATKKKSAKKTAKKTAKKATKKTAKKTVKKKTTKKVVKKTTKKTAKKAPKSSKKSTPAKKVDPSLVGLVTHYFTKISVCVIKVTNKPLRVGDTIKIKGSQTQIKQKVTSMQVDGKPVKMARKGQEVGLKINKAARINDEVFLA